MPSHPKQWNPGDRVRSRSGGPIMTVIQTTKTNHGKKLVIVCHWQDSSGDHQKSCRPNQLISEQESPSRWPRLLRLTDTKKLFIDTLFAMIPFKSTFQSVYILAGDSWSVPARRIWMIGNVVCVVSYLAAVWGAAREGLIFGPWEGRGSNCFSCTKQLSERTRLINDTDAMLKRSEERTKRLEASLTDRTSTAFAAAREALTTEEKYATELRKERSRLNVATVAASFPFEFSVFIFVSSFSWWIGTRLNRTGEQITGPPNALLTRVGPIILFAVSLLLVQTLEDVFTSILAEHKDRYHWTSFCVSVQTYLPMKIYFLGLYLMTGSALATPYWFGCAESVILHLKTMNLDNPDGQCGMAAYLDFVQKLIVIGFGGGLLPLYFALHLTVHPKFVFWYVLTPSVEFLVLFTLVLRLVRNVYRIREEYESERQKIGPWSVQNAAKLPPDPTIGFLGSEWWNLPASVVAILTLGWVTLDFLGIRSVLFPMK